VEHDAPGSTRRLLKQDQPLRSTAPKNLHTKKVLGEDGLIVDLVREQVLLVIVHHLYAPQALLGIQRDLLACQSLPQHLLGSCRPSNAQHIAVLWCPKGLELQACRNRRKGPHDIYLQHGEQLSVATDKAIA